VKHFRKSNGFNVTLMLLPRRPIVGKKAGKNIKGMVSKRKWIFNRYESPANAYALHGLSLIQE